MPQVPPEPLRPLVEMDFVGETFWMSWPGRIYFAIYGVFLLGPAVALGVGSAGIHASWSLSIAVVAVLLYLARLSRVRATTTATRIVVVNLTHSCSIPLTDVAGYRQPWWYPTIEPGSVTQVVLRSGRRVTVSASRVDGESEVAAILGRAGVQEVKRERRQPNVPTR